MMIRSLQKGMSLVELMVAITLGIFIAGALVSLFINSKENYRLNENMSRLQENARFAVAFLAHDLRMTDYRTCVTDATLADALAGEEGTGLNGSDSVTIIWQTNDCADTPAIDTTVYTIQNNSAGNPSLFRSVNGVNEELVEGIQSLQLLYGEDTDQDHLVDYYVNASSVVDMEQAISVRVTMVAQTLETNLAAGGGRITRSFTETVSLRNRLP